jgi:hypothetical protein
MRLSRERRIDWARLLDNIRKTGMSIEDIARTVDVGRSSVQDYCDDRCIEPAHWTGSVLLQLWSERTGLPVTDAPTRRVQASVSAVLRANRGNCR